MATTAPPANTIRKGVQPLRAGQGNSFLWRRLHSLSGIVPIGAFLIEHIISNFEILNGPLAYAKQVQFLNSLPLVRVLEWAFIFIPLAFHALYGVFIAFRGRSTVNVYPWAGNYMYVMQRVTGIIALLYIGQHVWRQRFSGVSLPEHPGAAFAKVQHELSNPWMLAIYVIAMIATTWHFAYGIWLFAAKWGITPGDKARKRFGYICAAFGTALCIMGLASIVSIVMAPPAPDDVMPEKPAVTAQASPSTEFRHPENYGSRQ
ncbi:succinate dehydrogenase subunit C [Granulicella rosea]|uniref:Succinate dehydrogenase subunit C n=1 Tax=Granulicella rosea TaxID=474952 RepID=A0A239IR11_9BACT|nr:succinate dehydrogenase cytochrome b558 subunit [Granulicella rosea]SNS96216.1 succinate dehydrogenase subunit C [Granulicella rosea]